MNIDEKTDRTRMPILSRNKREGFYGGRAWSFEKVKTLSNGVAVWKRNYTRHVRAWGCNRLTCKFVPPTVICHSMKSGS